MSILGEGESRVPEGETVLNVLIVLAALAALLLGYLFYGRYLAKKWGLDPSRETPSQDCFDGKDYVGKSGDGKFIKQKKIKFKGPEL